MSEHLTVIAHLRALNGQIEETRAVLTALIAPTRAEPGCVGDLRLDQITATQLAVDRQIEERQVSMVVGPLRVEP